MNTMNTIARDSYGSIIKASPEAWELVKLAVASKKLPASFDNMEWEKKRGRSMRIGTALHHEIYDYSSSSVLVCCREVEGTKYGQKTTSKTYFVVRKCGKGVTVKEANKAKAAKAAKSAQSLGEALAVVVGKKKLAAPTLKIRTGYKMVRLNEYADLVSVWDESLWEIGKTRTEKASPDHSGGFYYYATAEEAIAAAEQNDIFGTHIEHSNLVLLEVQARGSEYEHRSRVGTKLCVTSLKPVREFFHLISFDD